MAVIGRTRRTRQPQRPVGISNLSESPYSVWLPGFGDILQKADAGLNADTVTPIGRAYAQANGAEEKDVLNTTTAFVGTGGGFTILVPMVYGPNLGTGQGVGVAPLGGAVGLRCTIFLGDAGNVYFDYGGATAGTTRIAAAVPTSEGTIAYYVVTTGPRGMEIWNKGILLASNAANPTRTENTALQFVVGDCYGGTSGNAKYAGVVAWQKQVSSGFAKRLSENPGHVYAPLDNTIYVNVAAGGDVTVALTGSSSTTATGTLAPTTDKALSGASATGSTGTLSPATAKALLGSESTGSAGTLTPNVVPALTGVSATGAQGSVSPSTTIALVGESAIGATGTVGVVGDVTVALTGVSATGYTGTLTVEAQETAGGHFIPQYVTRKQKKRDDLREQLIEALYPVAPEVAEIIEADQQEIKQAVKLAPKQVQMQVAPIMAKLSRLEAELRRYQDEQDEEEMFDLWLMEVA